MTLLVDADWLLYAACSACEYDIRWDEWIHTLHLEQSAKRIKTVTRAVQRIETAPQASIESNPLIQGFVTAQAG